MSIYIGNLSYQVTEYDLKLAFGEYGKVNRVVLPTDRETGRPRGFAFVEMETEAEENAAIEALDGAEWMGRVLKVNKAKPREQRATSTSRYDSGTAIAIGGSFNTKDESDYYNPSSVSNDFLPGSEHQGELNALSKTELSRQHSSSSGEFKIVLKGNLEDISKVDLAILREQLRKLSDDSSIEIIQVEKGSIILKLSGTDEGFRIIKELWETGKLTKLIGLDIESVDYEVISSNIDSDDSASIEFIKNTEEAEQTEKKHSEGRINFIFDRCVVNQNNQTALSQSVIPTDSQGINMSENYVNNLQGANIANMANTVKDNARQQANQHIHPSEQKTTLAEAAKEIQNLLKQLEQDEPEATNARKVNYINDETSPSFKRRVVSALQAGGETAIEEFLDNPYINIGKAIVKGWVKPE